MSVINFDFDLGCFKTQRNKCCVFPFWYEGKQIYSCIKDNNIWPWCATTDNYTRDHLWDNCAGKLRRAQWAFLLQAVLLLLKRLKSSCRLYYNLTNNPKWPSALCTHLCHVIVSMLRHALSEKQQNSDRVILAVNCPERPWPSSFYGRCYPTYLNYNYLFIFFLLINLVIFLWRPRRSTLGSFKQDYKLLVQRFLGFF